MNPLGLNEEVSQTIRAQRAALADRIVTRQYSVETNHWQPYSPTGREKSVRDAGYHLSYLCEAIAAGDPSLFLDYIAWVKVLFAGLNFPETALRTTLECTRDVLRETLSDAMIVVADEYTDAGLLHLNYAPATSPSFLSEEAPLADLSRQYLDALLRGERYIASHLILDAVERGVSIKDIYLHVFQRTQREVGRLWQTNQITVAQEHYCTAATQLIMSQLYPHIFSTERIGCRLVATCVGNELHELGVRMVADFFELGGWDTYYLGANSPTASILLAVEERQADLLAISVTMTFHLSAAAQLVSVVRAREAIKDVPILIGGYPFNVSPDLWRRLGADGFARDAEEAIQVANQLMEGRCG